MKLRHIRLLPGALVSVPVFGVSLIWGVVVQVGEWAVLGGSAEMLALRLVLLGIVQIVMFAFPFVTLRVVCPRVPPRAWNRLLLVSLLLGVVVRGIALGMLMFVTGISDSPALGFRIAASLTHMAVVTVLLWYLVSEVRGLQMRRRLLMAERDELLNLQATTERDLASLTSEATSEIRRSILESLGGLRTVNSTEFRDQLRTTIDDVVRPLSHRLAAQSFPWSPSVPTAPTTGIDWPLAVREGLNPIRIHPVFVPIMLIWLGLPIHLFQLGPVPTASLVATAVVAIPAFWLARRAAILMTAHRGAGPKMAAFVVAVLIGGLALGLATLPYTQGQSLPFTFVVVGPILSLLISAPLAIAEAARDQDLELESSLEATTADLRWMLARTRERYRQRQGALAHALHGRLQASLSAAYLRLEMADINSIDDSTLVKTLQTEVRGAVSALDILDSTPEPIDTLLALTESTWTDVAHLSFAIQEDARKALESDSLCAGSVNDLIPELVFNCVRHGSARNIDIQLNVVDFRTLSLDVIDDGTAPLGADHHGLGSSLLDETSISWTRIRRDGRTVTSCLLPFSAGGLADSVLGGREADRE